MPLIKKTLNLLMGGKKTITKPKFIKDFTEENEQLKDLIELSNKYPNNKNIKRDINFLKQGLSGEKNVYFELKNSFIPMLCLHDIRIEYDNYVAQIDFIVITNKFIYVLETKKLNGDIEITKEGDFIRSISSSNGNAREKVGMYSPISQNERHVNILRALLMKKGLIRVFPIKSAIIMANSKSIIHKSECSKEISENIYKYDQIANLLKKELNNKNNKRELNENCLYNIACFLMANNKPITFDYMKKYSLNKNTCVKAETKNIAVEKNHIDNSKLYCLLKTYRLSTSRKEDVKPYMVFNNKEMDALIEVKPKTKQELIEVKGFGPKKIEKYGDKILEIINKN